MQRPATVTFILDSEYGLRAVAHARAGPVWLVNSPYNAQAARAGRAEGLNVTLLTANGQSPEDWFLNHLDSVDQHHNEQAETVPTDAPAAAPEVGADGATKPAAKAPKPPIVKTPNPPKRNEPAFSRCA